MAAMYAIVVENMKAALLLDSEETNMHLTKGMTVQVVEVREKHSAIIIRDYHQRNLAFENNVYICKKSGLIMVTADIWPFLTAINDPFERIEIARDKPFCKYILGLKENVFVDVLGYMFNLSSIQQSLMFLPERAPKDKSNSDYNCIIRYIGNVPEIGPGFYFGLELLNLCRGHSPQETDIASFVERYFQDIKPNLCFLLPVNFLKRPNSQYLKKNQGNNSNGSSVLNNLICGFKDIIKNPKHQNRNSAVDSLPVETETSREYNSPSELILKRPLTPPYADARSSREGMMSFPSSVSSPNLAKQDSGSSTSSSIRPANHDLITFESDSSRIMMSGARSTQTASSSSSASGDSMRTPKSKKRPMIIHAPGTSRDIKASTILRLEDRDLVVIDRHDIKEAVIYESDVIIVDPPALPPTPSDNEHVDLGDILVGQWPDAAGGAASLLNNERKSNMTTNNNGWKSLERNKSPNFASHFGSKPKIIERHDGHNRKKPNGIQYENIDQDSLQNELIADLIFPSPLIDIPGSTLGLGSLVEVSTDSGKNLHGVIRWIGQKHQEHQNHMKMPNGDTELVVGVELDEPATMERSLRLSDGMYHGQRCFRCPDRRAIFVSPKQCTKDRRFQDESSGLTSRASSMRTNSTSSDGKAFGADCPIIEGSVPALKFANSGDLETVCGKFKGIQGHHNSCYLDATLFSMFTFTSVFDSLLFRPRDSDDLDEYEEVQRVLRDEIVNPLRKNLFVRADRVLKLRQLLDRLSSVRGLVSEEKDPEEFLNSLLAQILRAEPFLKLSSGLDAFYYQLFIEKDERLTLPNVQQLFEQSFLTSDIKLKEVPSCLIIQMPRFGKNYKMYPRILPSQLLDVTDIIEDSPRQCTICGALAEWECRECFGVLAGSGTGLESTSFCSKCLATAHQHHKRVNHKPRMLSIPNDFKMMAEYHREVPRLFMELFAVICIETSHYVTFVKAGSGQDSPWVFFDSMADRKGEVNGYNIPEMVPVPDLPLWLSEDGARQLHESNVNDKHLPELAKRLYCDAYLMLYQSPEMMMYR